MKKWLTVGWAVVVTFLVLQGSGVVPAIVPQLVPTANKRGNSTIFSLASSTTPAAAGTAYCDDGSGNLTTSGCTGGSGTPGSTLFSSTTTAGPNNTASETSLIGTVTGSTTIAANTFTNGAALELRAQGFFSLPAVADSLTLRTKCGSTVLGSASFTPPAGSLTNGTFRLWLMITAQGTGASGALMTNGLAELSGSALTPSESKVLNTTAVSFDFTTACVVAVTAQWGAAQSGESISGTNVAAWFPGAPVTSVAGLTGAVAGQGTDTKVLTSGTVSGTGATLCTDANGGATTSGCSGGSGNPWLSTGDPTSVSFSWRNQGGASVTTETHSIYLLAPASSGDNIRGREIAEPATPVSITVGLMPLIQNTDFNAVGLYVTDGTKLVVANLGIVASNPTVPDDIDINNYNSVTSFNANLVHWQTSFPPSPIFVKVVDDGTNLTWSWSPNGVNFIQINQTGRTSFLSSPSAIGYFANSNNASGPAGVLLVSWVQGTS